MREGVKFCGESIRSFQIDCNGRRFLIPDYELVRMIQEVELGTPQQEVGTLQGLELTIRAISRGKESDLVQRGELNKSALAALDYLLRTGGIDVYKQQT